MPKHVLVPIDSFSLEEENFDRLQEFLRKENSNVMLTHVSDPSPPIFYLQDGFDGNFITTDEHRKACESYANSLFKKAAERFQRDVSFQSRHVLDKDFSHAVIQVADDIQADAIVMVSRKHRGISNLLSASKTSEVINESKIPIIVL